MLRGLPLGFVLTACAITASLGHEDATEFSSFLQSDDIQDGYVSLLQSGSKVSDAPNADFFDDVSKPVLNHLAAKGHGLVALGETEKAKGAPASATHVTGASLMKLIATAAKTQVQQQQQQKQPQSDDKEQPRGTSLSQKGSDLQPASDALSQPSGMKPLQGLRKAELLVPEREDIDDPRAAGFGALVDRGGAGSAVEQAAESTHPNVWLFLSLARLGARAAFRSAMPAWHVTAPETDSRTPAADTYDVDRSDLSAPGAASLLSRQ